MDDERDDSYTSYRKGRELMEAGDFVGAVAVFESSAEEAMHFKTFELLGE